MKYSPGELRPGEEGYKVRMELDWVTVRRERGKFWVGLGIFILSSAILWAVFAT